MLDKRLRTRRLRIVFIALVLASSVLSSCAATPTAQSVTEQATPQWTLVWREGFGGAAGSQPNPRYWNYDLGNRDYGNEELEFYTQDRQNIRMNGLGQLEIRALKNQANPDLPCWNGGRCPYTSARITTKGKVTFQYGKVEARIKVPPGRGFLPAFWSMGDGAAGWPDNGEIDVMEVVGQNPRTVYGTIHGPGYVGVERLGGHKDLKRDISSGFHVFALIKRPHEILWLVDGAVYHRVTPSDLPEGTQWVFERPFYLLLNLAVGGVWPGTPPADTVFPKVMVVDYVRVWRENAKN